MIEGKKAEEPHHTHTHTEWNVKKNTKKKKKRSQKCMNERERKKKENIALVVVKLDTSKDETKKETKDLPILLWVKRKGKVSPDILINTFVF